MGMQQGYRTGELDAAARFRLQRFYRLMRRFGFYQHRLAVLIESLADFRDGELSGGSLNQTYAQALFQLRNAAAEFDLGWSSARPAAAKPPWSTT